MGTEFRRKPPALSCEAALYHLPVSSSHGGFCSSFHNTNLWFSFLGNSFPWPIFQDPCSPGLVYSAISCYFIGDFTFCNPVQHIPDGSICYTTYKISKRFPKRNPMDQPHGSLVCCRNLGLRPLFPDHLHLFPLPVLAKTQERLSEKSLYQSW